MNTDVYPMIEEVYRRGQVLGSIEHLRSDDTVFPTQTKMILLKNGKDKAVGVIVFVTDITKRIKAEEFLTKRIFELEADNDQLEQRLEDKKAELSEAGAQLEQQIIERNVSEEKLKEYQGQVEDLNAELVMAEERFEQQITEHKTLEEFFRQRTSELTATNENLQQQISEQKQAIDQLEQYSDGHEQLIGQQIVHLTAGDEQLQPSDESYDGEDVTQGEDQYTLAKIVTGADEDMVKTSGRPGRGHNDWPLDTEKLRELAEMIKRLSKRG